MSAQHTPGPWHQCATHVYSKVEKGANICTVSEPCSSGMVGFSALSAGSPDFDEAMANARLISAAPELLEALTKLRSIHSEKPPAIDDNKAHTDYCLRIIAAEEQADAAIAKATEGTS